MVNAQNYRPTLFWGRPVSTGQVLRSLRIVKEKYTLRKINPFGKTQLQRSSLHCNISLSFCLFSYNGVGLNGLDLSVSDVIVSLKSSNGDGKLQFFRRDYNFTMIRRKHTPLYEKDTK